MVDGSLSCLGDDLGLLSHKPGDATDVALIFRGVFPEIVAKAKEFPADR